MIGRWSAVLVLFAVSLCAIEGLGDSSASAQQTPPAVIEARQAVVFIAAWDSRTDEWSCGSGVIIGQTEVLTAAHVVPDGTDIHLWFHGGVEKVGRVSGINDEIDLAVVTVDNGVPAGLAALPWTQTDHPSQGSALWVWGYPLCRGGDAANPSLVNGIVSAVRPDEHADWWLLETNAALNQGNSGGPWLTEDGIIVGITSHEALLPESGIPAEGLNFATSLAHHRRELEALAVSPQPVPSADGDTPQADAAEPARPPAANDPDPPDAAEQSAAETETESTRPPAASGANAPDVSEANPAGDEAEPARPPAASEPDQPSPTDETVGETELEPAPPPLDTRSPPGFFGKNWAWLVPVLIVGVLAVLGTASRARRPRLAGEGGLHDAGAFPPALTDPEEPDALDGSPDLELRDALDEIAEFDLPMDLDSLDDPDRLDD